MPTIIDYPRVLARMTDEGLCCNYPNSGAFGFPPAAGAHILGWIGPDDPTIKPAMRSQLKIFPAPYESNLAAAALDVWQSVLPGLAWVMPSSHWHFELHDGSRAWMPAALDEIKIDPAHLTFRPDGSALEFHPHETAAFSHWLEALLTGLSVSDFVLAFPGRPVLCMIHHHKQLWWTFTDPAWRDRINRPAPPTS